MRLWSLHPRHLDPPGLVALWREGLLARAVLSGLTRGYRNHPQLVRFRARREPVAALDCYLSRVFDEAVKRGYNFNRDKINYRPACNEPLEATQGQLDYEWRRLLDKLAVRDPERGRTESLHPPEPHPCFRVTAGPKADWERGL